MLLNFHVCSKLCSNKVHHYTVFSHTELLKKDTKSQQTSVDNHWHLNGTWFRSPLSSVVENIFLPKDLHSQEKIKGLTTDSSSLETSVQFMTAKFNFHHSLIENSNCSDLYVWKASDVYRRKEAALYSPSGSLSRSGYKIVCASIIKGDSTGMKKDHETLEVSHDDTLKPQLQKETFLWRKLALKQKKLLEHNTSALLNVQWLEFQSLLLLTYGDVESNPGPLKCMST